MKHKLLWLTCLLAAFLQAQAQELTVCTYNVRYDNNGDVTAGNGWTSRRTYLINFMNFQQPDLLGVQEALVGQVKDMANGLNGYGYIGVGRTDGAESGEYSAIYYRKERMVLLDWGYFWLSDTPYKPSKGFPDEGGSTSFYRIATWGKFFDRVTGTPIWHFNTHFDLDETNRQQSYYLMKQVIEEKASRTAPVIVTGDFNAEQTSGAYSLFSNSGFLYDCYSRTKQRFMNDGTSGGFNANVVEYLSNGELRRIDHIFVTRAWNVDHYGVLNPCYYATNGTATYHERKYSDHNAVVAKISLRYPENGELDTSLPPVSDGIYQISTAGELQAFSRIVNGLGGYEQDVKAKAALTGDIDLADMTDWKPIGTAAKPFQGSFDGQGHAVRNLSLSTHDSRSGFFGSTSGATIQNFSIDGNLTFQDGTGCGVVGWTEGSTVRQVHSSLNIAVPGMSSHVGGVIGSMRTGTKAIACSFNGTITETGGSTDCIGGIAGYTNENCLVENCANYGSVSFTAAGAYAGGIIGYVNNNSFAGVKNCLNVGPVRVASGTSTYGGAIGGRLRNFNSTVFQNNYWLEGSAERVSGEHTVQADEVSEAQLSSGETCYRLNGDQSSISWYQTLGMDPYPVLFADHLQVLLQDGTYVNEEDPTGIRALGSEESRRDIFNLAGQRLTEVRKGINIVGGKKVLF